MPDLSGTVFGRPIYLYAGAASAVFACLTVLNVLTLTPAQDTGIVAAIVAVLLLISGSHGKQIETNKVEVAANTEAINGAADALAGSHDNAVKAAASAVKAATAAKTAVAASNGNGKGK